MNRRELLHSGAGLSLAMMAGLDATISAKAQEQGHERHGAGAYGALAASAGHCVTSGQVCVEHCLEQLAQGDKDLAKCAQRVLEMTSACTALQQLANWNSAYLPRMAKVVQDICRTCEEECRKHETKHAICKDCADSCAACAKECQKVAV